MGRMRPKSAHWSTFLFSRHFLPVVWSHAGLSRLEKREEKRRLVFKNNRLDIFHSFHSALQFCMLFPVCFFFIYSRSVRLCMFLFVPYVLMRKANDEARNEDTQHRRGVVCVCARVCVCVCVVVL
uniref:Transmembrane protein n=1 Tax=Anopheles dirus TaxID=7168 RepID=A0A182NW19_9DIPT